MPLTINRQDIELSGVGDVTVTTIEQDPSAGDWVRVVRVFGPIPSDGSSPPVLLDLTLRSPTRDVLEITIPASNF